MTLGTDSLASNHTLSIWEEVQTILKNTDLDLNTLLTWACKNGAEFLQLKELGTFEKGKIPGVNLGHKNKVQRLYQHFCQFQIFGSSEFDVFFVTFH